MVRSKEPSKKKKQPKDPLLTPPSKPRGGGFLDEGRPWNRGGAAMSPAPAPASVPSYMRGTSSSDAKVGRRGRPAAASVSASASPAQWRPAAASVSASASPARRRPAVRVLTKGKVLFPEEAPGSASGSGLARATCSSTMKDTKFPDALDLAPGATDAEGPAALRVCPYTYCSLNGHVHAPAVPLRSFLASRRRLIKTQQSMKLKGASPFRKPSTAGGPGYFVEIRAGSAAPTVTSDVSCSDLSAEDAPEGLGMGAASVDDGSCASSDVISVGSVELLGTTKHRGREEKTTLVEVIDHEDEEDFGGCKSDVSEELGANHGGNLPEGGVSHAPKESSVDSISSSLSGISFEDVSSACAYAASSQKKDRSSIARRRRTSEQGVKQMRPFKPKPPNFLPAETGPEAETVDLKHQAVDDRRAAEEWMVDYALRKEVKKLARAQKRKVEMLVQAFESVLPTVANEKKKPEQQDNGDKRTFTLAWPSQACS